MKRIYLLTLFFVPYFLMASDSLEVKKLFAIKTDLIAIPVPFFFKHEFYFSVIPEISICKKQSIQLQLFFDEINEDYRIERAIEIVPEYKYYFGKQTRGLFGGAYFKYINQNRKYYDDHDYNFQLAKPHEKLFYESVEHSMAFGPLIGYECNFKKHWVGEIIIGYGYKKNVSTNTLVGYSGAFRDETNDDVVLALNVGYRF